MVRWCWLKLQCLYILLFKVTIEQGSTAFAVGAGGLLGQKQNSGVFFGHFLSIVYNFPLFSPSLGDSDID